MKKSTLRNLGVMAVVLCLVTTCLLGGTLAKYTSTITGGGTATVAKWSFNANGQTDTFTAIDLAESIAASDKINAKVMAPGTEGSFKIELDAGDSDVGIDYKIVINNLANKPANLKFYSDAAHATEITPTDSAYEFNGNIAANASTKTTSQVIYWAWAYGDGVDDKADAGATFTMDIEVTGTQVNPTTTTP